MDQQIENMDQIDLKQLWRIFKNNVLLLIVFTITAMIVAAAVSFFVLDKQYESYTTLMLGKPNDYKTESGNTEITYNDVLLNQQLVSTYSQIAKSRVVTTKVIKKLNLDFTNEGLANIVSVTTVNDTEIIKITVKDTDPILAAKIANEMANTFSSYVKELMQIDNINIIDVAEASTDPVEPRPIMNIAIAMVLGLMLGVFVVFIREYLDTRIKNPEEIEFLSSRPILAMIPHSTSLDQGEKK
ncbi:MAG: hypothetical protein HGA49_01010 [Eubacteriaceae bacterium]|nr:hypothetical protein [Eubacteriaceae bacterium]